MWKKLKESKIIKKRDICLNWLGDLPPTWDIINNKNWVGYTVGEFQGVYPDGTVRRPIKKKGIK